jgi:hypothetical protein
VTGLIVYGPNTPLARRRAELVHKFSHRGTGKKTFDWEVSDGRGEFRERGERHAGADSR